MKLKFNSLFYINVKHDRHRLKNAFNAYPTTKDLNTCLSTFFIANKRCCDNTTFWRRAAWLYGSILTELKYVLERLAK